MNGIVPDEVSYMKAWALLNKYSMDLASITAQCCGYDLKR
jgi:hypothetical protein